MAFLRSFSSKVARGKTIVLWLIVVTSVTLAGCRHQLEDQVVRWTGAEGSLHAITTVHLLASGRRYDRLNVGVGGYIGPHLFGRSTSLFFVQEHTAVGDPMLGIWLVGDDEILKLENICDNIGSYVVVVGKYTHKDKRIQVDRINWVKEPEQRMDRAACEQLTEL